MKTHGPFGRLVTTPRRRCFWQGLAILFLTCHFLQASLLYSRAKVRGDVAVTGRAERSVLTTSQERTVGFRWHFTCGRPAEGSWSPRISPRGRNKAQTRWSGKHQLLRAVFLVCGLWKGSGISLQRVGNREPLPMVSGLYVAFDPI